MEITFCDKFVQIELTRGTKILEKVLDYADKHFSQQYRLSSSILILDDGERFKKDYLINWAYHATLQNDEEIDGAESKLQQILSKSHLPIRIKITNPNDLLAKVKVNIHFSNLGQIILRIQNDNRVAKRYIRTLFHDQILYEADNEFCINGNGYSANMWEGVIELISSRIIHNVALEFEFEKTEPGENSFLTREEFLLQKCYSELDSNMEDDLESIKKQYIKLAKIFHPDNAKDKDEQTIKIYQERFNKISQAYKTIKSSRAG